MSNNAALDAWLVGLIGRKPGNFALYETALTHGSASANHYERLEFLGDRVLGLVMAGWLYQRFPNEKEGQLSRRFNQLVTGSAPTPRFSTAMRLSALRSRLSPITKT